MFKVGHTYKTRRGMSVDIVAVLAEPDQWDQSVIGVLTEPDGCREIQTWCADGLFHRNGTRCSIDLIEEPALRLVSGEVQFS